MDKNEDQFLPAKRNGKKTHITNLKSQAIYRAGDSRVDLTKDSSIMHQEGSHPITYSGPVRMSGKGTAKEMGVIFKQIGAMKPKDE